MKNLQMQVFDQPADTTGKRGKSEMRKHERNQRILKRQRGIILAVLK